MRYWKKLHPTDPSKFSYYSYSHNQNIEGAIEITKTKFDEGIASLKPTIMIDPKIALKEQWSKASDSERIKMLGKALGLE